MKENKRLLKQLAPLPFQLFHGSVYGIIVACDTEGITTGVATTEEEYTRKYRLYLSDIMQYNSL